MLSEASYSDFKFELIQKKWTHLLLKWINKCVISSKIKKLTPKALADVMAKYNSDICVDDIDRAMLCSDDVEPFMKFKYPILRLRYVSDELDDPKRLYILTSMVLYHCCISSQTGAVDADICKHLTKYEQELILKFCEYLCEMEATLHNVQTAIKGAFQDIGMKKEGKHSSEELPNSTSSDTVARATSSDATNVESLATLPSRVPSLSQDDTDEPQRVPTLKFNSSVTVLPSVIGDTATYSDMITESEENLCYMDSEEINIFAHECEPKQELRSKPSKEMQETKPIDPTVPEEQALEKHKQSAQSRHRFAGWKSLMREKNTQRSVVKDSDSKMAPCLPDCACARCSTTGPCCGEPGSPILGPCKQDNKWLFTLRFLKHVKMPISKKMPKVSLEISRNLKIYAVFVAVLLLIIFAVVCATVPFIGDSPKRLEEGVQGIDGLNAVIRVSRKSHPAEALPVQAGGHVWECNSGLCKKAYLSTVNTFTSYSRCVLICMGPQLWPYPIGYTSFSKDIVAVSPNKLEYKFQSIPSEAVNRHIAEAFKNFLGQLSRLEKSSEKHNKSDMTVKKMNIQIDVESDPDPRLRLNTEESYHIKIDSSHNRVVIEISSASFCGIRHGLETLLQMILLDHDSGTLITLTTAEIQDAPSYKYRGLMIDTGRNYIPVPDLMRTLDAMASVKLNTFHWRVSDVTSFPLLLSSFPQLFEHGAYDRDMVYTKEDVKALVSKAGFHGIRVLIEVAAPGPVGRPWSWSPGVTCPTKVDNYTCDNLLCMRMSMTNAIFQVLQTIYSEILEMTHVDDVFHLSDGIFSLGKCFYLIEDREGFLDVALVALKQANKGFLPKLPVVWYTPHLLKEYEARAWERLGVQLNELEQNSNNYLSKFKVIHSSKWDLSCEIKKQRCRKYRTWQEMYAWKQWRNVEAFTIEGGEAVLWTDLVNGANLDFHLWPRAAAVAERLWSDMVINVSASGPVYLRLDSQRWRMLFRGINVQPVWPIWCSFNPDACLLKLAAAHKK